MGKDFILQLSGVIQQELTEILTMKQRGADGIKTQQKLSQLATINNILQRDINMNNTNSKKERRI